MDDYRKALCHQLLAENSKKNVLLIASAIARDEKKIKALVDIMKTESPPLNVRASWVFSVLARSDKEYVLRYFNDLLPLLSPGSPEGMLRNLLQPISVAAVPPPFEGIVFDTCFSFAENKVYPHAVRANAMTVLYRISLRHPPLQKELISFFEQMLMCEHAPSIKARARLLIKKLSKQERMF